MFEKLLREAPDARCVLCNRTKAQVRWMVKGQVGSVCSDCVPVAARLLEGKQSNPNVPFARGGRYLELVDAEGRQLESVTIEIEPELAKIFKSPAAINSALRLIAQLVLQQVPAEVTADSEPTEPTD